MIAQYAYEASEGDERAAVEKAYNQKLRDNSLIGFNAENISNLSEVLEVTALPTSSSRPLKRTLSLPGYPWLTYGTRTRVN